MEHSIVGPSSAERWMRCHKSINLIRLLGDLVPPEEDTEWSTAGTRAHEFLSLAIDNNWSVGELAFNVEIDLETLSAIGFALDTIAKLPSATQVWSEHRVSILPEHDVWGTLDYARFDRGSGHLTVIDYKHGEGIEVDVVDNPQLLLYALGLANEIAENIQHLTMMIIQPRAPSGDRLKVWELDEDPYAVLYALRDRAVEALERIKNETGVFAAGEHCRFCTVKPYCPAFRKAAAVDTTIQSGEVSAEGMADLLDRTDFIRMYLREVGKRAYQWVADGGEIVGRKLVTRVGHRAWKEGAEKVLIDKLGPAAYNAPGLLSPAQAEKILGKPFVKELATAPVNGVELVSVHDKRKAVKNVAASVFADHPIIPE